MVVSTPGLGIGKFSQDVRVIEEVVGKGRREMESERWAGKSESERGKGVVSSAVSFPRFSFSDADRSLSWLILSQEEVVKKLEIKQEIAVSLKPF